ncbi:hypothetical protein CISIN_1g034062mg [Citrus sinensis]|uniref:Uncharacterized protein n=1 Tax=Citrus sinensis TaxID=2711 RepID=A0A067H5V0_CITSI|nr:hypothetical protein CISIN_1g034062mg [Citrus sinensis]
MSCIIIGQLQHKKQSNFQQNLNVEHKINNGAKALINHINNYNGKWSFFWLVHTLNAIIWLNDTIFTFAQVVLGQSMRIYPRREEKESKDPQYYQELLLHCTGVLL